MLVKEIVGIMKKVAPPELVLEWDNPGLQLGRLNAKVTKAVFALDLTANAVAFAKKNRAELIITHHPVIYQKLANVADNDWQKDLLLTCAENKIAVFSAHTNWDAAKGGVNDVLAKALGLKRIKLLPGGENILRVGEVPSMSLTAFVKQVKKVLQIPAVTYVDGGKKVHKVAVCGGAGADFLDVALAEGCDTFVTADIKYRTAQRGAYMGLNMIDGTHQGTERIAMEAMRQKFAKLSGLETLLFEDELLMKVM